MKRRHILTVLAWILALTLLAGCGGKGGNNGGGGNSGPNWLPTNTENGGNNGGNQGGNNSGVEADVNAVKTKLENAKAGDKFELGSWEQDGKTINGKEAISWIVLRQDVGKALVVSEYVLDFRRFKEPDPGEDARWTTGLYPDSDIRTFLVDDFYVNAFTAKEKALILPTAIETKYVEDYKEKTAETTDPVFLLSIEDVGRYLTGKGNALFGIPTAYVLSFEPYMSDVSGVPGIEKALTWWLRDMGNNWGKAATVDGYDKKADTYGVDVANRKGVRPAMWIVYNEADMKAYERGEIEPKADPELDRKIASLKVGDKVTFGRYDMNPRSSDGYEELDWTVIDETDDAYLLFMDYSFYFSPLMARISGEKEPEVFNWADSSLRKALNDEKTLNSLFTPQEKAKILKTHLTTSGDEYWKRDGGPETDDYLFLPDLTEIMKYFPSAEARLSQNGNYWLRSPSFVDSYMGFINANGSDNSKDAYDTCGVRPMVWIRK